MSLAKKVLISIAVVIGIIFISAAAAYKLIDDKVIEDNALNALKDTLKRNVTVEGDFTLSRSLHPTLRTTGVSVASADWDTGNHLLKAEKLEFGIALLDLLRGVITIQNIVFEDAVINIKRNAQGESNLEFAPTDSEPPANKSNKQNNNLSARFDVIDVKIENLTVNYSDLQSDTAFVYALDEFVLNPLNKHIINITTNSRFDEQPIIINSKMCRIRSLLRGEDCPITAIVKSTPFETSIKGDINIAGQGAVKLNLDTQAGNINEFLLLGDLSLPDTDNIELETQLLGSFNQLSLNDIKSNVELENTELEATGNIQSINTLKGIDLSVFAQTNQPAWLDMYQDIFSSELIKEFKANTLIQGDNGDLKVSNIESTLELKDTTISVTGDVTLQPQLSLALLVDAQGEQPAWLNEFQQAIAAEEIDQFSVTANINSTDNIINVNNIDTDITVGTANTSAQGDVSIAEENQLNIELDISAEGKNFQDLEILLKQPLPQSSKFSLKTLFSLAQETIKLNDLSFSLDDTALKGSSEIELSSPPNIRAQLNADTLNIEHIVAMTQPENNENDEQNSQEKTKSENEPLFSDAPIDLDWLGTADTDISLSINNLVYKDANIEDVKASVSAKNNIAAIDITSLKYLDANLTSKTAVNASNNTYAHSLFTEGFDLGKLLAETKTSSTLQGKIDASVDITSFGTTSQEIAANANGKITSVMTEGSLADAPIDLLASNLLVELMPGKSKKDTTKIECLFVQFTGQGGVFKSDAALLNTENIVMTTNGDVDLNNEKLNLLLVPKPKNIELFTLDANIRVSGDIADPSFSLDKGSVFKKLLKSAATVALGPAALAVPFASMGDSKSEKCFSEVASVTTKAVEAQQEAERLAREQAEKEKLEKEALEEATKEAMVEPLDP